MSKYLQLTNLNGDDRTFLLNLSNVSVIKSQEDGAVHLFEIGDNASGWEIPAELHAFGKIMAHVDNNDPESPNILTLQIKNKPKEKEFDEKTTLGEVWARQAAKAKEERLARLKDTLQDRDNEITKYRTSADKAAGKGSIGDGKGAEMSAWLAKEMAGGGEPWVVNTNTGAIFKLDTK